MNERMESLDALVRQVMPLVLPCPRGMVLDALRGGKGFVRTGRRLARQAG